MPRESPLKMAWIATDRLPGGYLAGMRRPTLTALGATFLLLGLASTFSWGTAQGPNKGPSLEWRSLGGDVRRMGLDETPGGSLEALFGTWMRPVGLAPWQPVDGSNAAWVGLPQGDRLQCLVLGGDAMSLQVQGAGQTGLQIPIDGMLSLEFPGRRPEVGLLEAAPQGDRLYRLSGSNMDRVDGVLTGFSEQGIGMETSLGDRVFPWGEVVALFIEPLGDGQDDATQGPGISLVDLVCGSRLRGQLKSIDESAVTLTQFGLDWRIPYPWIREMTRLDDRFKFLSWVEPLDEGPARSPFDPPGSEPVGMVWPHRLDRTVSGGWLTAGGRVWSHGIGVHAPSQLRWELDGTYCSLRLSAGLDDTARRAGMAGSVTFAVHVDGQQVWSSGIRRGGEPVLTPEAIDLTGAKMLELIVTDGGDGPVLDRAAWLSPILIRCP